MWGIKRDSRILIGPDSKNLKVHGLKLLALKTNAVIRQENESGLQPRLNLKSPKGLGQLSNLQ